MAIIEEQATALTVRDKVAGSLNNRAKVTAIARSQAACGAYVPHLGLDEVRAIADAAGRIGRHRERDRLLIQTMFDGCLRVSECLGLRPRNIKRDANGWRLEILGKGGRPAAAAISASLGAELQSYAYMCEIARDTRLFPVNRSRAFQIVNRAMAAARIQKPEHVGTVHILRHSGAIERLRATRDPRAVQEQLRHASVGMTLRYLKTVTAEEAIAVQQEVDFRW